MAGKKSGKAIIKDKGERTCRGRTKGRRTKEKKGFSYKSRTGEAERKKKNAENATMSIKNIKNGRSEITH